jgi:glycerol-3-phosphate acyltransferase PlsY
MITLDSVLFYFIIPVIVYLWGSIPYGYIITRYATGKNIMQEGSGNIGSTNVGRIAGKKLSLLTQLSDIFKGLFPVFIILYAERFCSITLHEYYVFAIAIISVLGHDFSVFLKFRGGKGVNTTLGASVLLAPFSVIAAVIVYYVIKRKTGYVSAGSIALAITLPLTELIIKGITDLFWFLFICSILIIATHYKNILRLLRHEELKHN